MCSTTRCSDSQDRDAIQTQAGAIDSDNRQPLARYAPVLQGTLTGASEVAGQSPLYALGGPRSAQFTLEMLF
jgi:hypothetical protein